MIVYLRLSSSFFRKRFPLSALVNSFRALKHYIRLNASKLYIIKRGASRPDRHKTSKATISEKGVSGQLQTAWGKYVIRKRNTRKSLRESNIYMQKLSFSSMNSQSISCWRTINSSIVNSQTTAVRNQ